MDAPSLPSRSLRRSHVRARIVHILLQRGPLHAGELVDLAGIDNRRLRYAMHGDGGQGLYRDDLSLVRTGLVEEVRVRRELAYRMTQAGRLDARAHFHSKHTRDWPR